MGAIVTSEFNGMRLTLAREIQNISSPKLAEKIGVTKQTVSQYENGLIKPSADKVLAISQELKFPPKFFFEGSSDNFSPGVAYCRATTTTTRAVKLRQDTTMLDATNKIISLYADCRRSDRLGESLSIENQNNILLDYAKRTTSRTRCSLSMEGYSARTITAPDFKVWTGRDRGPGVI